MINDIAKSKHNVWQSPMTQMENIVMNSTHCNRSIANTVVNAVLDKDRETESEATK